jgi:hypothetical protein
MELEETVSSRQSHSSVSLILASLFIFVFVCDFASQPSRSSFCIWDSQKQCSMSLALAPKSYRCFVFFPSFFLEPESEQQLDGKPG